MEVFSPDYNKTTSVAFVTFSSHKCFLIYLLIYFKNLSLLSKTLKSKFFKN